MNILLVDDEPRLLRAVSRMLETAGHYVTAAGSGVDALRLIEHYEYDVILSDVRMPEISGPDLMLKMRYENKATVVFMSGDPAESVDPLIRRRARGFLRKPFALAELISAIDAARAAPSLLAEKR